MANKFNYAVIGSGKQGTAEGYDLVTHGNANALFMVDNCAGRAKNAADRINKLSGHQSAHFAELDASNESALIDFLVKNKIDVVCGAAHYALNLPLTRASIAAKAHFCDMGGNTTVVHHQHRLHSDAEKNGVTIIPDCGIAPGTANILAAKAMNTMNCESIQVYCGGLPQRKNLPLGYRIVFSVQGLTNEYTGKCIEIRNNRIVEVDAFTEKVTLTLPEPVGQCEAFLTSGGTSTGPWSFLGKVTDYGYKTVRYPGHYDSIKTMVDMGFLNLEPVDIENHPIVPRELFHTLASKYWDYPDEPDLLVMQVIATGKTRDGKPGSMTLDLMDFQDNKTGFTAMERTTAYSASIIAIMMAKQRFKPGVQPLELAVDPDEMIHELMKRGIKVSQKLQQPQS